MANHLVIEVDETAIADYEVGEEGKPYREWCMSAELANRCLLGVIYDPLDDTLGEAWWEAAEPKAGAEPVI